MHAQNNTQPINTQHFSSSHSFSLELAQAYGLEEAILLGHILYWLGFNKRKKVNFIEGRTWMYQTQEDMSLHHPYWNRRQIMRILQSLIAQEVIIAACFNKNKQDKTQWYALKNEEIFMSGNLPPKADNDSEDSKKDSDSHETDYRSQKTDLGEQKLDCLIGKDTRKEDTTRKAAAAKSQVLENTASNPPLSAAVSFSDEKGKAPEGTKPLIKEQNVMCKALDELDIPIEEKEWLLKHFKIPDIELSIAWAYHPTTQIKTTRIQAIKWFLKQSLENRPKVKEKTIDLVEENKKFFLKLQSEILREIVYSETHEIGINLTKMAAWIGPKNCPYINPQEIKLDSSCFKENIVTAMHKGGFQLTAKL